MDQFDFSHFVSPDSINQSECDRDEVSVQQLELAPRYLKDLLWAHKFSGVANKAMCEVSESMNFFLRLGQFLLK